MLLIFQPVYYMSGVHGFLDLVECGFQGCRACRSTFTSRNRFPELPAFLDPKPIISNSKPKALTHKGLVGWLQALGVAEVWAFVLRI